MYPRLAALDRPGQKLTRQAVAGDRILFLHGRQYAAGSPEPDVRCSGLPFCGDHVDLPGHPDVCYSTRALRIKVRHNTAYINGGVALLTSHRERKCRTYHWAAFILSNVVAEIAWNTGVAVICFLVWFYPMGLLRNARWTGTVNTRSTLVFLNIWSAFLFGSTLAHALIAGLPTAEAASALGNVLGICVCVIPSARV
jgi:hypothetical protein